MAKIGDLVISSLKIANNSFSRVFYPYSGPIGTNRYIDITFEGLDTPVLIWIEHDFGNSNLYYNWTTAGVQPGAYVIYRAAGYLRTVVGDLKTIGTHTYALQGSGSGVIKGAIKRYR